MKSEKKNPQKKTGKQISLRRNADTAFWTVKEEQITKRTFGTLFLHGDSTGAYPLNTRQSVAYSMDFYGVGCDFVISCNQVSSNSLVYEITWPVGLGV